MSYGSTLSEQSILFIRSRESLWHLARPWRVNISTSGHGKGRNPNVKRTVWVRAQMDEHASLNWRQFFRPVWERRRGNGFQFWVPVWFRESQRSLRLKTKTSSLCFHSPGFSKRMLTCLWLQNIFKECFSLCFVHCSDIGITWQLWEMYILRPWSQTNQIKNSGVGSITLCSNKSYRWFWCLLKFENHFLKIFFLLISMCPFYR